MRRIATIGLYGFASGEFLEQLTGTTMTEAKWPRQAPPRRLAALPRSLGFEMMTVVFEQPPAT